MSTHATGADLGQAVRRLRKAHGLKIEVLAFAADMHPTYLSSIERGRRNPTWAKLCGLANALEVSVSTLAAEAEEEAAVARIASRESASANPTHCVRDVANTITDARTSTARRLNAPGQFPLATLGGRTFDEIRWHFGQPACINKHGPPSRTSRRGQRQFPQPPAPPTKSVRTSGAQLGWTDMTPEQAPSHTPFFHPSRPCRSVVCDRQPATCRMWLAHAKSGQTGRARLSTRPSSCRDACCAVFRPSASAQVFCP